MVVGLFSFFGAIGLIIMVILVLFPWIIKIGVWYWNWVEKL